MKYKLEIRSIWEYGQRKDEAGNPHQEDSLFPRHSEFKESDRVFILCDGMGGHAAGEVASATVCEAMSQKLLPLAAQEPFRFCDDDMRAAVTAAYDALDALDSGTSGKGKMGTTMTALVLHDGGATIAHMGDSRVYHIRPGKGREETQILFQTRDHSLVNDLVAVGEITAEEAKTHPQRNVITRALQPHMEQRSRPDIAKTIVDIRPGDYFYLCSDGMLEIMDDNALRFNFSDTTGDIDSKVKLLTTATSQNRDNHTAILVHVLEVEDAIASPAVSATATETTAIERKKSYTRTKLFLLLLVLAVLLMVGGVAYAILNKDRGKAGTEDFGTTIHELIYNNINTSDLCNSDSLTTKSEI